MRTLSKSLLGITLSAFFLVVILLLPLTLRAEQSPAQTLRKLNVLFIVVNDLNTALKRASGKVFTQVFPAHSLTAIKFSKSLSAD